MDQGPALVSILRQGDNLIASIHTALDDAEMVRFQRDLIEQIGQHRARGVIIDVAAVDVPIEVIYGTLDPFLVPVGLRIIERMRHVTVHRIGGGDHLIRPPMARVIATAVESFTSPAGSHREAGLSGGA